VDYIPLTYLPFSQMKDYKEYRKQVIVEIAAMAHKRLSEIDSDAANAVDSLKKYSRKMFEDFEDEMGSGARNFFKRSNVEEPKRLAKVLRNSGDAEPSQKTSAPTKMEATTDTIVAEPKRRGRKPGVKTGPQKPKPQKSASGSIAKRGRPRVNTATPSAMPIIANGEVETGARRGPGRPKGVAKAAPRQVRPATESMPGVRRPGRPRKVVAENPGSTDSNN
jgi:hypothetical protein